MQELFCSLLQRAVNVAELIVKAGANSIDRESGRKAVALVHARCCTLVIRPPEIIASASEIDVLVLHFQRPVRREQRFNTSTGDPAGLVFAHAAVIGQGVNSCRRSVMGYCALSRGVPPSETAGDIGQEAAKRIADPAANRAEIIEAE